MYFFFSVSAIFSQFGSQAFSVILDETQTFGSPLEIQQPANQRSPEKDTYRMHGVATHFAKMLSEEVSNRAHSEETICKTFSKSTATESHTAPLVQDFLWGARKTFLISLFHFLPQTIFQSGRKRKVFTSQTLWLPSIIFLFSFFFFFVFFCIDISPEAVFLLSAVQILHHIRRQRDSQLKKKSRVTISL